MRTYLYYNINAVQLTLCLGLCTPERNRQARGALRASLHGMPEQCPLFLCVLYIVIPRLEVLQVLQNISPEWLQHLSLHILSGKQGQHLDGQVCGLLMHVQRELSSGVSAIASQQDLGVPP